jgi:minor extracellular serine protease Vpr
VKTKPAPGKQVDFSSNTTKSYRAQLSALRNDFKQWLRANAPAAKVTGEFDISLNAVAVQLNGSNLGTIASAPMVKQAQYEGLYRPMDNADPDLALIHAIDAWTAAGGAANAGAGVKVGIIDTGIDQTHPCLAPAGYSYSTGFPKGNRSFTTQKVIVAKVFNNQSNRFGYTPEAVQDHGTHVAGTVACNLDTAATVAGVSIPYGVSGVAPKAWPRFACSPAERRSRTQWFTRSSSSRSIRKLSKGRPQGGPSSGPSPAFLPSRSLQARPARSWRCHLPPG